MSAFPSGDPFGGAVRPAGRSVHSHEQETNPHPQYATDVDLAAHVAAGDPHTGYLTESAAATTYQPIAGDEIWASANDLYLTFGTPALGLIGSWVVWLHDAAAAEEVAASVALPSWWATFDVDLYWSNAGAGAGNVVWGYRHARRDMDGTTLTGDDATGTLAAVAAPAQNVSAKTTILTGIGNTKKLTQFRVVRLGASGTDTLANDAAVLGFLFRRAS